MSMKDIILKIGKKCPIEQVHLQFCKHLLGVDRSAANLMCQAELGRLPLKIVSDLKVGKFAKHCECMPPDDLISLSMQLDCQLYQQNNCIPSLSRFISDLKDMHGDQFMTISKKKRKVEIIQNYRNETSGNAASGTRYRSIILQI